MRRCYYSPLIPLVGILFLLLDLYLWVFKGWEPGTYILEDDKYDLKFWSFPAIQALSLLLLTSLL